MIRPVRVGLMVLSFGLFGLISGLLSLLLPLALLAQLGRPRAERLPQRQRWLGGLCRLLFAYGEAVGLCRYAPPPRPAWEPGARVLVANHPSLVDVLLILAVIPEARCMVGASWFRHPLMGALMRAGGHFSAPARRAAPGEESGAVEAMVQKLAEGATVLIFPEGTRSPPGGIRRFRLGAAEAARRSGAPIQPLRMGCDPPALTREHPWYRPPDRAIQFTLAFLDPLDPAAEGLDTAGLTRRLKGLYAGAAAGEAPPA